MLSIATFTEIPPLSAALLLLVILGTAWVLTRPVRVSSPSTSLVVISGCDTGFGRLTMEKLSAAGFRVVALCLTPTGVEEAAKFPGVTSLQCDISKQDDCDRVGKDIQNLADAEFAGAIHALVNNAGIMLGSLLDFTTIAEYEMVMQVNFFGAVRLTKSLLPLLKKRGVTVGGAKIINVTSLAGLVTAPGMSTYTASKHAIQAWSDAVALELAGFGIHVASVNPTFFRTNIVTASAARLARTWAAQPQHIRDQYGDRTVERNLKLIEHVSSSAGSPSTVVDVITDLATRASAISPRYCVGLDVAMLSSYLPHIVRHTIVKLFSPGPQNPQLAATAPST